MRSEIEAESLQSFCTIIILALSLVTRSHSRDSYLIRQWLKYAFRKLFKIS